MYKGLKMAAIQRLLIALLLLSLGLPIAQSFTPRILGVIAKSQAKPKLCRQQPISYLQLYNNPDSSDIASTPTLNKQSQLLAVSDPSSSTSVIDKVDNTNALVGDDAAYFSLEQESLKEWVYFSLAVATILTFIAYIWVLPAGPRGGDIFLNSIQSVVGTDPAVTVASMLTVFGIAHSGLAGLRTYAEPVVGARFWRVIFASVSLPLALSCISYFINHAHEGTHYWDLVTATSNSPVLHYTLVLVNFVSFLFLYPSTFNLLEVAAIRKPELRLWETGVIRITRHPQAFGQLLWCLAHTIYFGTSTAVAASAILIAHHAFAVYHGDRRLADRHGADFDYIKSKTSIVPFQAIIEGRQKLPSDYYKEFLRGPYFIVIGGTIAAYFAHPWMMAGAALLDW